MDLNEAKITEVQLHNMRSTRSRRLDVNALLTALTVVLLSGWALASDLTGKSNLGIQKEARLSLNSIAPSSSDRLGVRHSRIAADDWCHDFDSGRSWKRTTEPSASNRAGANAAPLRSKREVPTRIQASQPAGIRHSRIATDDWCYDFDSGRSWRRTAEQEKGM